MRIAVIGAGIIGVTTAYELSVDGHEVTVFERDATVATGASFAHTGLISPGQVMPWAADGMPLKAMAQLFKRLAPGRPGLGAVGSNAAWWWRWWRASRPAVHPLNRSRLFRLARYSRDRIEHLTGSLNLVYERAQGHTVLLRSERDLARARPGLKLLAELGVPFELMDAERTRQVEPGLHGGTALRGAIHLPQDGVGNCREFAHLLKAEAHKRGARFCFQQTVQAIEPDRQARVRVAGQTLAFDAVVVCAGAQAAGLLAPAGLHLPLLPVWGCSLTLPLRAVDGHGEHGPRAALMDQAQQVLISRLGRRLRVAGGAELVGDPQRFHAPTVARLYKVLHDWFPGAAHVAQAHRWTGARPMLPDGPPVLGASGLPGVWLNVGHGDHGWALAAGSARVLADGLAGRSPDIDPDGLGIQRLA